MAKSGEFDKTHSASTPMSKQTNPGGARSGAEGAGKARGVEHPIPEDMALIGDTRNRLHTASLPKHFGPNDYGLGQKGLGESDQFRVDCGEGASGEC